MRQREARLLRSFINKSLISSAIQRRIRATDDTTLANLHVRFCSRPVHHRQRERLFVVVMQCTTDVIIVNAQRLGEAEWSGNNSLSLTKLPAHSIEASLKKLLAFSRA